MKPGAWTGPFLTGLGLGGILGALFMALVA